jgi:PEP-CTERM motif-containing protein
MTSPSENRRSFVGLAALSILAMFFFVAQPASADTVTFVDTGDTITVTHVGSQHDVALFNTQTSTFGSCSDTETFQCDIFISSPTGAAPTSPAMALNIAEPGTDPIQAVSDNVLANPGSNSYLVIFASDPPGDPAAVLGLTPLPGAPSIIETGGVQTAFTLSWSDQTSDLIQFQSDLDTPEPGTLLLLGTGLLGLGPALRRRIRLM